MADKPIKRPGGPFALAKLIGDIATGQSVELETMDDNERRKLLASRRGRKTKRQNPGKRGKSG